VQFGSISKFGLMEMSRQRLKPALSEGSSIPCPRCGGSGHIRDTESSALQILRIIQEESLKDHTASVLCQVPVDVASFLLNEKRAEIAKIELKQRINVLMVPNKTLETPKYKLERLKHDDPRLDHIEASYKMADEMEDATSVTRRSQEPTNKQTPVIKGVLPDAPAPVVMPRPETVKAAAPSPTPAPTPAPTPVPVAAEKGFFGWIKGLFGATPAPQPVPAPVAPPVAEVKKEEPREGRDGERREGRRGESRGGEGRRNEARTGEGRRGEGRRSEGQNQGDNRPPREGRRGAEGRADPRADLREGEVRPPRAERPERGERTERSERPERNGPRERREAQPAVAGNAIAPGAETQVTLDAGEPGQERPPRTERGEGRRERGERGEGRRERGERGERRTGAAPRTEETVEGNAPAAAELAATTPATTGSDTATAEGAPRAESEERRERRSRDRYGRDRRERNGERGEPRRDEAADAAPAGEDAAAQEPVTRSYFERPAAAPVSPAPVAIAITAAEAAAPAAPVAQETVAVEPPAVPVAAPVAVAAPAPEPVAAPEAPAATAAPLAVTPVAAEVVPVITSVSFELPLAELTLVAERSGLQWVNSDPEKIAAVQAAIAAEPKAVHVPRERAPLVTVDEGPLVLVETRKDLRELNLPF
jgi:ribonuclease E